MITKVEVITARSETLELSLLDFTNGCLVKHIGGLDPVKASIVSSPFATMDGTQYQNSRRESRNIVLKLGLEPEYGVTDVSTLRNRLYNFLMPKTSVTLRFYVDDVYFADIWGRVESCESDLFAKEPEITASFICFDPDFVSPENVVFSGNASNSLETPYTYPGNIETGFTFKTTLEEELSYFRIENRTSDGEWYSFEFVSELQAGDTLEICTISGSKGAWIIHDGTYKSILYGVHPSSPWINLFPGVNNLRIYANDTPFAYTIEYRPRYGGL